MMARTSIESATSPVEVESDPGRMTVALRTQAVRIEMSFTEALVVCETIGRALDDLRTIKDNPQDTSQIGA